MTRHYTSNPFGEQDIVSDINGGAYVGWIEDGDSCFTQRIDAMGISQWDEGGIPLLRNGSYKKAAFRAVRDTDGNAYFCWNKEGNRGVFVQKIDSSSTLLFSDSALFLGIGGTGKNFCSDGANGVIALRGSPGSTHLHRISPTGKNLWTESGASTSTLQLQGITSVSSDSAGGAFVVWRRRGGIVPEDSIFSQWVDVAGSTHFGKEGVVICADTLIQDYPAVVGVSLGTAICAWTDYRNRQDYAIYAAKIHASGVVSSQYQSGYDKLQPCLRASIQNPVSGDVSLKVDINCIDYESITMYDSRGSLLYTIFNGRLESGANFVPVRGSQLSPGQYFIGIHSARQHTIVPFTVVR